MSIVNGILSDVDHMLETYVFDSFTALNAGGGGIVSILWTGLATIFIGFHAYKMMAAGDFRSSDLLAGMIRIIVVLVIATTWGPFMTVVYNTTTNVPSDIAGQIVQATNPDALDEGGINSLLSSFYNQIIEASSNLAEHGNWRNFMPLLFSGIVLILGTVLLGMSIFFIILGKIAIAVLLAVGPIFILMLMFTATRGFFEGWLRNLVNYALIPLFVYVLLGFVLALMDGVVEVLLDTSTDRESAMSAVPGFALMSLISTVLLLQVSSVAAALSGGFALASGGALGSIGRLMGGGARAATGRTARKGYAAAGRGAATAASTAARGIGRQLQKMRGMGT